ncbi:MAG: PIN domain-containing protein [Parvularculaceae bacterium]
MAKIFLDTNVLIYFATKTEPSKSRISRGLLEKAPIINVQVLNEFISAAQRKLEMSWPLVRDHISGFRRLCQVTALTPDIQARAVEIAERHRFHIYDANIVAAGEMSGAAILYSEDLQAGRRFGDLEIVNPYA